MKQKTIEKSVCCSGVGLHKGGKVSLQFHPAPVDTGIRFAIGAEKGRCLLKASPEFVVDTSFATCLGNGQDKLHTVEHVLAAVRGLGIDNIIIEVLGGEIPIMDGSAASFVYLLNQAGLVEQKKYNKIFSIARPVILEDKDCWIKAKPYNGFSVDYTIVYAHPLIGKQRFLYKGDGKSFTEGISRARTFGFLNNVEYMQSNGYIKGGSLDNALVFDNLGVVNPEGMRFPDEPVQHKLLDFIGDIGLLPYPVWGSFEVYCSGHTFNYKFLQYLAENKDFMQVVDFSNESEPVTALNREVQLASFS